MKALEIPDFETRWKEHMGYSLGPSDEDRAIALLMEIWNARGAADAVIVDGALSSQMGGITAGPYVKNLQRAISSLDAS